MERFSEISRYLEFVKLKTTTIILEDIFLILLNNLNELQFIDC